MGRKEVLSLSFTLLGMNKEAWITGSHRAIINRPSLIWNWHGSIWNGFFGAITEPLIIVLPLLGPTWPLNFVLTGLVRIFNIPKHTVTFHKVIVNAILSQYLITQPCLSQKLMFHETQLGGHCTIAILGCSGAKMSPELAITNHWRATG
jgi:hypothetical protein